MQPPIGRTVPGVADLAALLDITAERGGEGSSGGASTATCYAFLVSEADIVPVPEALVRVHATSERRRAAGSALALVLSSAFSAFWFLVFLVAATPIAFLPLVALASSLIGVGTSVSRAVRAHRVLGALGDGPGILGAEYVASLGLLVLRRGDGRSLSLTSDDTQVARARRIAQARGVLPQARLLRG